MALILQLAYLNQIVGMIPPEISLDGLDIFSLRFSVWLLSMVYLLHWRR